MRAILAVLMFVGTVSATHAQQTFTCSPGQQPSCLPYGAIVCDGVRESCTDRSAICFDKYACGVGTGADGFVCRSDSKKAFDKCAAEYDNIRLKYRLYIQCIQEARNFGEVQACIPQT